MLATIAICTFNRAESLRRTLESLAAMEVPNDVAWEVVVVNNNCTDHTDTVIEAFAAQLPIRREFEAQRGHSRARNCAVDAAKGDYIVWTDDDVVVDRGWLAAYVEAFRRSPDVAVFGGHIVPRYETPVVKWVAECAALLVGPYAVRDFGNEAIPLSLAEERLPFGANFALRAIEQRTYRYNPELGLGPVRRRLGDETDVIGRILQSGATGYWVPNARVDHCISHERQTVDYVSRWYIGRGETTAFLDAGTIERTGLWFGAPRWLWRRLVGSWLRYHLHRLISPPSIWLTHLQTYAFAWGNIRYWRSQGKQ